jgi:NAD(P)-dependent dehydrogenase (short-subunit alcohol dehydrogenase family)
MRLDGKTAIVTGAGQGIGAAVARALGGAGATLVLAGRTLAKVEAVAAELRQRGRTAWAVGCDVSEPAGVERLAAEARDRVGPVDILVNNAGVASAAPLARIKLEEWERMLRVNATGPFLCTQAFVPGMVERKWGRVVTVASVAGLQGAKYIAAYTASKHAAVGLTRAVAAEVAAHGVTVNAVCPGYVDTPMTETSVANISAKTGRSEAEARAAILATTPQARLVTAEEVAHLVLALCVEEGRSINGQAIVMDGGGLLA